MPCRALLTVHDLHNHARFSVTLVSDHGRLIHMLEYFILAF